MTLMDNSDSNVEQSNNDSISEQYDNNLHVKLFKLDSSKDCIEDNLKFILCAN